MRFLLILLMLASQGLAQTARYKVGLIDLMLLKRQKLGAITLTQQIGADGLELDMGGLGKDLLLKTNSPTILFVRFLWIRPKN
jgi:hypothetical protein